MSRRKDLKRNWNYKFSEYQWLDALMAGVMDSQQMLEHYLLLHDAASGADYKQ